MQKVLDMLTAASEKNQALLEQINAFMQEGNVAAIVAAASDAGFEITEAEWREYADWSKSVAKPVKNGVLSEEELESVSGGGGGTSSDPYTSKDCWFWCGAEHSSGKSHCLRSGRCSAICGYDHDSQVLTWYQCRCWGTKNCEGGVHVVDSRYKCPDYQ